MKRRLVFALLVCVTVVYTLGVSTTTNTAIWSDPEPKGIIAIK